MIEPVCSKPFDARFWPEAEVKSGILKGSKREAVIA